MLHVTEPMVVTLQYLESMYLGLPAMTDAPGGGLAMLSTDNEMPAIARALRESGCHQLCIEFPDGCQVYEEWL